MTGADYDEFMLVVRQLELHRDAPRSLVVDRNRQLINV